MSRNLQGITFGFFEELSSDDKIYLEDILYGTKSRNAKLELPWEDDHEKPPASENPSAAEESNSLPATDVNPVPLTTELPPAGSDVMPAAYAAAGPPSIHQPVYHLPVAAIPGSVIPMVGMCQQGSVPINIVPVIPHHQGLMMPPAVVPPPPPEQVLPSTDKMVMREDDHFSDGSNKSRDKEASKILGGKTYERRNKKKRPANYYEKKEPTKPVTGKVSTSSLPDMSPYAPFVMQAQPPPELLAQPTATQGQEQVVTVNQTVHGVPPTHCPPSQQTTQNPASLHMSDNVPCIPATHTVQPGHNLQTFQHTEVPNRMAAVQGVPESVAGSCTVQQIATSVPSPTREPSTQSTRVIPSTETQPSLSPVAQSMPSVQIMPTAPSVPIAPVVSMHSVPTTCHTLANPDVAQRIPVTGGPGDLSVNTSVSSEIYTDGRRTADSHYLYNEAAMTVNTDKVTVLAQGDKTSCKEESAAQPNIEDTTIKFGTVHLSDVPPSAVGDNLPSSDMATPLPPSNLEQNEALKENAEQAGMATGSSVAGNDVQKVMSSPSSESETKSPPSIPASSPSSNTAQSKPKSWAGLFQSSNTSSSVIYNSMPAPVNSSTSTKKPKLPETITPDKDGAIRELGALLKNYSLCYKSPALLPRGLINKGNWCYVNATLQALLACAPFCNLLRSLPSDPFLQRGPTSTPVLDSMIEFINEFSPMPPVKPPQEKNNKGKGNVKYDLPTGQIFEPTCVYNMLQVIRYDGFKGGKQEDAEEFLSCLLNGLHDEMVAAIKIENEKRPVNEMAEVTSNGTSKPECTSDDLSEEDYIDDVGWEQVGPKNRSVVTRTASFDKSPISEIFRGQIRNILNRQGVKESANLQPFFTLQLEIQPPEVKTVQEALNNLVSKEQLHDFTCSKTKMEVDASRRTLLEKLPAVLLLHLKYFVYDKKGGCQKMTKQIDFSENLDLHKDLISSTARNHYPPAQRKYKLFAVVKHIGAHAAGGHYVADIYNQDLGEWVHYDDNNVYIVSMPQVFKFRYPRVPYLLYYRRVDLS